MTDRFDLGPLPTRITGSCHCGRITYRIDFPDDHNFKTSSGTCRCRQCRKSTSSLFFIYHQVPYASVTWTSPLDTLKRYYCTAGRARGFCSECSFFLFWRDESAPSISVAIGSVDPLYLFGEGWETSGGEVPEGGFGRALANGCGRHEWVWNEIPGATDGCGLLGAAGRGERVETD